MSGGSGGVNRRYSLTALPQARRLGYGRGIAVCPIFIELVVAAPVIAFVRIRLCIRPLFGRIPVDVCLEGWGWATAGHRAYSGVSLARVAGLVFYHGARRESVAAGEWAPGFKQIFKRVNKNEKGV